MIPDFDADGFLPPGVHPATLEEIADRFGQSSELRRVQMESIRWMLEVARRAGVRRIVLNGSFVTDIIEPNDVDCVMLAAADPAPAPDEEEELLEGLPFLDIKLVRQDEFDIYVNRVFAIDRQRRCKGTIEVIQWS